MTLKFESKNLNGPSGLADKLNLLIGDFNDKTGELNSRHRRAFAAKKSSTPCATPLRTNFTTSSTGT